jgi:hypothetical protein
LAFRDSFGDALVPYLASETESATFSKLVPYNMLEVAETGADLVIAERVERHIDYLAKNAPVMPCPSVELDVSGALPAPSDPAASVAPAASGNGAPAAPAPPSAPAPAAGAAPEARRGTSTLEVGENGPLASYSGTVDSALVETESRIYVKIRNTSEGDLLFEAFTLSLDGEAGSGGGGAESDGAGSGDAESDGSNAESGDAYLAYVPKSLVEDKNCTVEVYVQGNNGLFLVKSSEL